ncbi:hypothetical protein ACE4RU_03020 [Actinobacillus seminis]|uniref:hypothetical protein n=1 Tax=Actinobacillus seminis TaxID=722 RepID=UPI003B95B4B8
MEYNRIVKAMLVAGFALNVNIALAAEALKIKTEDFTTSQGNNRTDLYDKTKIANEDKFGEAKDESNFPC